MADAVGVSPFSGRVWLGAGTGTYITGLRSVGQDTVAPRFRLGLLCWERRQYGLHSLTQRDL